MTDTLKTLAGKLDRIAHLEGQVEYLSWGVTRLFPKKARHGSRTFAPTTYSWGLLSRDAVSPRYKSYPAALALALRDANSELDKACRDAETYVRGYESRVESLRQELEETENAALELREVLGDKFADKF